MKTCTLPDRPRDIRRTLVAAHLNVVANDPAVRPWLPVANGGPVDWTPIVSDPRNYAFETESGGFVLRALGYGRYEAHSLFLPTRAPQLTVRAMRQTAEYLFTRTDCVELVTTVPEGNRRAGQLAALAHFHLRQELPDGVRYLVLDIDTWALHACDVAAMGQWWSDLVNAPHEASANQMRGAMLLMVAAGQVEKGTGFYNRWARWRNERPVSVVSLTPAVLDLGDTVIEVCPPIVEVVSWALKQLS